MVEVKEFNTKPIGWNYRSVISNPYDTRFGGKNARVRKIKFRQPNKDHPYSA